MAPVRPRLVVPLVIVALSLAACGEDSAEDRACEAGEDLREAVTDVKEDVAAANFGDARNELDDVTSSFNELRDAVTDLADEQDTALQPAVDQLSAEVSALSEATSVEDLGSRIDAVLTSAQGIYDQVASAVDCD
jgi:hypothetical protein